MIGHRTTVRFERSTANRLLEHHHIDSKLVDAKHSRLNLNIW